MKVVKEGNWKLKWEEEMTCQEKNCGAVLLVEEGDLKPVDYDGNNHFYFVCPVCGTHNRLNGTELPLRIQNELNKHRKYSSSSGWD